MDYVNAIPVVFADKQSSDSGWRVNKHVIEYDALLHWHDFYEFEMVVSGKGTFVINGVSYNVKKGFICCMNMSDLQEVHVEEEMEVYNIAVRESVIDETLLPLLTAKTNKAVFLNETDCEWFTVIFEMIISEYTGNDVFRDTAFNNLFNYFLVSLIRRMSSDTLERYVHAPDSIHRAILYINEHFKENPRLSDISKMLFLDDNYFCTLFRKCMGVSYKSYLRNLKLNYAARLIKDTQKPIKDIHTRCGYSSKSPFYKEFKEFFGVSPAEMRAFKDSKEEKSE